MRQCQVAWCLLRLVMGGIVVTGNSSRWGRRKLEVELVMMDDRWQLERWQASREGGKQIGNKEAMTSDGRSWWRWVEEEGGNSGWWHGGVIA